MPFTFSHPAIVLPLYKSKAFRRVFPFLVIGSMSPDFEYFLRLRLYSAYSHSLWGILYFCIPVSLLVYVAYAYVVRPQLAKYYVHAEDTPSTFKLTVQTLPLAMSSIALGAFSHIAWDSFTHMNGFFVTNYPWFFGQLFAGIPLYKIFQHTSTVIGGVAMMMFLAHILKNKQIYLWHRFSSLTIVLVVVSVASAIAYFYPMDMGQFVATVIAFFACSILLASLVLQKTYR